MSEDGPPGDLGERGAELERFLADWVAGEPAVPGLSVAVVEDGAVAYAEGFGARDLASNAPATPDTLYGVASCTKSVTATAISQLVEGGDVALSDPVSKHLSVDLGDEEDPITIHDLLTHTSGVPADGMAYVLIERLAGIAPRADPLSDEGDFDRLVAASDDEIAAPPGERFYYYNSGYTLLGRVVEAVSGRPFREYVRHSVLDPLGMERSTFSASTYADDPDAATPYVVDDDGDLVPADLPVDDLFAPPAGLLSSPRELTTYLRAHLGDGAVDGTRLLSPASAERVRAGHVDVGTSPTGEPAAYGYGWFRTTLDGATVVGHEGNLGVSSAYVGFAPEADVGVALCANTGLYSLDHELDVVGLGALAVLLGGDWRELPFFALDRKLDRLAGTYESGRDTLTVDVTRDGGVLRVESTGLPPFSATLVPETHDADDWRFTMPTRSGTDPRVRFEADEDGTHLNVMRWRLHARD